MTPEEYIGKLKEVQRALDSVKDDIERSIDKMERRIETGYSFLETESRLSALCARDYVKMVDSRIYDLLTSEIDY